MEVEQVAGEAPVRPAPGPSPAAVARWCAAQGWPVHPLAPGAKVPPANCSACQQAGHDARQCRCRAEGRWCHGFHAATTEPELIDRWWSPRGPGFGVGVSCGPAGLVVVDVDAHDVPVPPRDRVLPGVAIHDAVDLTGLANGYHSLALLAALNGSPNPAEDAATLRVRTPSGGLHIWYRSPQGLRLLSSGGSSSGRALAWQVDIRAHGGYIIAPGTTTPAGTYQPLGPVRTPAPLPSWLARELVRTGHTAAVTPPARPLAAVPPRARQAVTAAGGGTPAERLLASAITAVTDCAVVPSGAAFSDKLNRAAFTAGGLVAAGRLDHTDAFRLLMDAARTARPGQDRRARQIIVSGMAAGERRPLHCEGRPS
ncbi:hypothetical protein GCM10009760_63000 [Kitasatospora kazusensis]|uniref:DNA primase/polymerase bifunctional N-terminal domain-containing protein n=1 Tax=Kitasatospora kazusensis TaxID=407974 RepID=A0ABN1ZLM5_9ACTN